MTDLLAALGLVLLYDDIRFVINATVPAVVIGPLIGGVVRRRQHR